MIIDVYEFIKSTPSIRKLYMAAQWVHWHEYLAKNFPYTVNMYKLLGVHVYFLQEIPFQPDDFYETSDKYKHLLDRGKLTNKNLRNLSLTRSDFDKADRLAKNVFDRFNEERGFTYVPLCDLVCDKEVCSVGTGDQPFYADRRHFNYFGVFRIKKRIQKYLSY
jgi:hypothetical protein